jgi:hypothetical protein
MRKVGANSAALTNQVYQMAPSNEIELDSIADLASQSKKI